MIHQLEADSIVLNFGSRNILSDVYIKCETGKITGLLGRNGNGKTTLMNVIYGTLNGNSQSIRFNGDHITQAYRFAGLIGYLTQFNFTPKSLTLKRIFSDFEVDYSHFEKMFPEFQSKYNSQVKNLSGGQIRLTETYLLLKSDKKFVFLDEPFTHLSPILIEQVKQLITKAAADKGILLSDHMYRHVLDISTNLYLLSDGKTRLIKNAEELNFMGYTRS